MQYSVYHFYRVPIHVGAIARYTSRHSMVDARRQPWPTIAARYRNTGQKSSVFCSAAPEMSLIDFIEHAMAIRRRHGIIAYYCRRPGKAR